MRADRRRGLREGIVDAEGEEGRHEGVPLLTPFTLKDVAYSASVVGPQEMRLMGVELMMLE